MAFFILSSNTSAWTRAMPSLSSLSTINLCPPVRPNLSRAAFGITSCPRSFIVTDPHIFLPFGAGGIFSLPSIVSVFIRLSIVTPYRLHSLLRFPPRHTLSLGSSSFSTTHYHRNYWVRLWSQQKSTDMFCIYIFRCPGRSYFFYESVFYHFPQHCLNSSWTYVR